MHYGMMLKVCFTLILSFYNYASTFELNNGMRVHESYGDSVKQFNTKVQNFEQKKIYKKVPMKLKSKGIQGRKEEKSDEKKREIRKFQEIPLGNSLSQI